MAKLQIRVLLLKDNATRRNVLIIIQVYAKKELLSVFNTLNIMY